MRALAAFAAAIVFVGLAPLYAQTDDRDYLTAFLEDNLSDAGRDVTITGFAGALSSRATIQQMTIADGTGIWITLNGVTLDWSRSALLQGQVEINALTADEILVDRLPRAEASAIPDPEARGFSLPDLPVSVQIGQLAASRIVLGPEVLGSAVVGQLEASLSLADGEGQARLDLVRTDDGPDGRITLAASYANASRQLAVDLSATEAAGGIFSTALNLPGTPSIDLTIAGAGAIDEFTAEILLATDDVERVSGRVALRGDTQGGIGFSADLAGNFVPLLAADQAAFFGDAATLKAAGTRDAQGGLRLDTMSLATDALRLDGQMLLAPDGQPLRFDLTGDLGLPDGSPVVLPLPGVSRTAITSARIAMDFDAAESDRWRLDAHVQGVQRDDITIGRLALTGSGRIARTAVGSSFGATLKFAADDTVPADPALAEALGRAVSGEIVAYLHERDDALQVPRLAIAGQGYGLTASGQIGDLKTGLILTGKASAEVADLGRLSTLAGRALQGTARIDLAGTGSALGGGFDVTAQIDGQSLAIGQPEVDRLLADGAKITLSARRDETGLLLRQLEISAATLAVSASGRLSSTDSDVAARLEFADLSALGRGYGGALVLDATLTGSAKSGQVVLRGQGTDLTVGQPDADRLLRGTSDVQATLAIKDEAVTLDSARLTNPQVKAEVTGQGDTTRIEARLANLGVILPEFPGAVTLAGTATDTGPGYRLDLAGTGPAQISARLSGTVAKGGATADLTLAGTAQSALANAFIAPRTIGGPARFDLRLAGPLALRSLTGQVTVQGARFSDVERGIGIRDLDASAVLSGGRAVLKAAGALSTGGRVTSSGTVALAAPYAADIAIALVQAKLRNPELFEAETSGQLRLNGPLLGGGARLTGRIDVASAEIRIPSGSLSSLGAIPDIRHVGDTADVRDTRRRAGLFGTAGAAGGAAREGPVYGLDILVVAPNRLFIRGRGLDAELSGQLRLGGTTANVVPAGQFSLIRGRLDILGRRLVLSEARLQLQGDFVPTVAVAASDVSDGVTSTVRIDGPATDPVVIFSSNPDLPQEEVLARLLFGRGLQNLSAFQAAQLANAVATLAGRGSEGIIGRLRKTFGLDDFDVTSDATGSTVLRAGKYLNENVYTEVEVGQDGQSEINLNLDLRPGVTVSGRVGADGQTGLGIFLERDY